MEFDLDELDGLAGTRFAGTPTLELDDLAPSISFESQASRADTMRGNSSFGRAPVQAKPAPWTPPWTRRGRSSGNS